VVDVAVVALVVVPAVAVAQVRISLTRRPRRNAVAKQPLRKAAAEVPTRKPGRAVSV
jgi:hypothetical protein